MDQKIKTSLGTIILIIIAITAGLFIWHYEKNQQEDEAQVSQPLRKNKPTSPIACTEEAKACPDGSYVSRTGPNCEFAPCSNAQIVGGQCEYDKVPGTCTILSLDKTTDTARFNFASTGTLPDSPLAKNLNGEHSDTLGILNNQNLSLKVSDKLNCEANLETKGTCTPVIFKFTGSGDIPVNGWQTYMNEKNGFSFQYPQNWKKSANGDFFLAKPEINVLQLNFKEVAPTVTASGFVDNFLAKHDCKNPDNLKPWDHLIEKTTSGIYYAEFCSASSEVYHYTTKLKNGSILEFSYQDNFDENSAESEKIETLKQIISTFKFTK